MIAIADTLSKLQLFNFQDKSKLDQVRGQSSRSELLLYQSHTPYSWTIYNKIVEHPDKILDNSH